MAPKRREKVGGFDLKTPVTVQTRRLRSQTKNSPCSGQPSTATTSEPTIDGNPGDTTRTLRSRTVKIDTSPCSAQLSTPTIDGSPGDKTRRLRSRTVETETSPCSGQLSTPTIDGNLGDNTRRLRSQTVKAETSPYSGQLSAPAIDGCPGDNTRRLCSQTVKNETSPFSGQLSTPTIDLNLGDNTRRLRSRTVKTETPPFSGQHSMQTISEVIIDGNPSDNTRRLRSRTVETKTPPSSVQLSTPIISEPIIDGNPSDNTRRLRSRTVKTETSPCSGQLSTPTISELTIDGNPGDNVENQARLTSDGLPGDWIKEEKPRKKDSSRKDVFYIDPKTGYAFRSLKDALRYAETGDVLSCASRPAKRSMDEIQILRSQKIKSESTVSPSQPSNLIKDEKCGDSVCEVVLENIPTSLELPKSWIKELRPRKNGSIVDQFYIEPDTGYAFWSVKDALRYVATGNIRSCRIRPKKRSIEEVHALINSPEMPSTSGMKTVQQDSLPLVCEDRLHRKRKRSRVKPSDLKPDEKLKTEGTEVATRTASWREKRRERPLCVRASPRLVALKAAIETDYDGNYEENNELCITVPSAPSNQNRATNCPPDPKPEEAIGEIGSSKIRRERPVPLRTSSQLADPKATTDATSVENENNMANNALSQPTPSLSYPNTRNISQPDLEFKEKTTEETHGSSTGTTWRLRQIRRETRKMRKESRTIVRASSRLTGQKVASDTTAVESGSNMMSNALFEPSPSFSYPEMIMISQPDLEFKEETTEGTHGSSTGTTLRQRQISRERRKMPREKRTTLRASSSLTAQKVTSDTTVENGSSMMGNALFEPSPSSLSCPNMIIISQPDLEFKEETTKGTPGSSIGTTLRQRQICREIRKMRATLRAPSRLTAQKVISDTTTIENGSSTRSNALFEPSASFSYQTLKPTGQPDLGMKETVEGTKGDSSMTLSSREKMSREMTTPVISSSCLAAVDATVDATSVKNKNSWRNNASFEPPPSSLEDTIEGTKCDSSMTQLSREKMCREMRTLVISSSRLAAVDATVDATSVKNENSWKKNASSQPSPSSLLFSPRRSSQPDLELEEERTQGADGSSTGTVGCPSDENKNNSGTNAVSEPPHSHPDLNLGPTSQPDCEFKEVLGVADGKVSRTIFQREMPATMRASFHLSAIKSTTGVTCDEIHEENKKTSNAFSEVPLPPARPDLNFGPTSQPYWESKEETIVAVNGSETGTISCRETPTSVKVPPFIKTVKVTTEAASSKSYEKNSMISQPYREPKVEKLAANASETGTISRRGESCREIPASVEVFPCLKAPKVTSEVTSSKSSEFNNISNVFSESSHFHGRPDLDCGPTNYLNFGPRGPTNYLNFGPRQEMAQASASATGTTLSRMELDGTRSTPGKAIKSVFYDNYGKNIEKSNYRPAEYPVSQIITRPTYDKNTERSNHFSRPVEHPASQIITGPTYGKNTERSNHFYGPVEFPASPITTEPAFVKDTERNNYFFEPVEYPASQINMVPANQSNNYQPNPEEFWLNTTITAPASMGPEVKGAPDLNMVPMSCPEPRPGRVLESYPGHKLKLQQPASINTIGELRSQPPASSEIPYQDPTMDALLGGQEAGPSMPHMPIDALNSPTSAFFGDFWHDPSLSYAFRTLTGGMRQQQLDQGLGPANHYRAGTQNGGPTENLSILQSQVTNRNPHYRNNGMLFPK